MEIREPFLRERVMMGGDSLLREMSGYNECGLQTVSHRIAWHRIVCLFDGEGGEMALWWRRGEMVVLIVYGGRGWRKR